MTKTHLILGGYLKKWHGILLFSLSTTKISCLLQDVASENPIFYILLSLYLILAKEKISVSNASQIKQICDDFADWFESRNVEIPSEHQKYVELLLKRNVCRLILKRNYISIRHRIAVAAKNTGIYQKLRG